MSRCSYWTVLRKGPQRHWGRKAMSFFYSGRKRYADFSPAVSTARNNGNETLKEGSGVQIHKIQPL